MKKLNSRFQALTGPVLAALLFSSCAPIGEAANSPEPEISQTQNPSASVNEEPTAGYYIPYESFITSGDKFADSNVVLFFNAVWCSTCKQARDNIEASLSEIPEDLAIVVVDFDNATDLRKKYGVTVQHTFIQIASDGEAIAKWSGSISVAEIVDKLN